MSLDQLKPVAAQPVLATVSVMGDLHDSAAARLLRWCEARLHVHDTGEAPVRHLLIDLSHSRNAALAALVILDHARTEAERRGVGIHLVGAGALMATASPEVRHRLGRWRGFPTLDVARAALAPDGPTARPVDPDAIVLMTTTHDRLR